MYIYIYICYTYTYVYIEVASSSAVSNTDLLTAFFAAACHDVAHPGVYFTG